MLAIHENRPHHLRLSFTDAAGLYPTSSWGIRSSITSTAIVRDHLSDRINTYWYELNPFGFLDLPECSIARRETHLFPGNPRAGSQDGERPDLERQSTAYGGQLVTTTLWKKDLEYYNNNTVYGSICVESGDSGSGGDGVGRLFPLAEVGPSTLSVDFCPLSGIMVAVSDQAPLGLSPRQGVIGSALISIRIYDFAKPRLPVSGKENTCHG